jgi:uncharacterized protein YndB with AHSA1/START domain
VTPAERLQVTASGRHDIVLTRSFAAPRRLVFDAMTRPELLVRWHGAQGWNLVVCEVDLRAGGAWRFVSEGPAGETMGTAGTFLEIDRPGRLVQTEAFDGWDEGEHAVITTVLDERDGRTTMTATARYPSQRRRDAILATPMERGAGQAYDRLAAALAAVVASSEPSEPSEPSDPSGPSEPSGSSVTSDPSVRSARKAR